MFEIFKKNLINTKGLYLCEINEVFETNETKNGNKYFLRKDNSKYVLATLKGNLYKDILTNQDYKSLSSTNIIKGDYVIRKSRSIETTKNFITKEEAEYILDEIKLNIFKNEENYKILKKILNRRN